MVYVSIKSGQRLWKGKCVFSMLSVCGIVIWKEGQRLDMQISVRFIRDNSDFCFLSFAKKTGSPQQQMSITVGP